MGRPGPLLRTMSHRRALSHRRSVRMLSCRVKQARSATSTALPQVSPRQVDAQSPCNRACGTLPQRQLPVACPSYCTVITCDSGSTTQKQHVFTKAGNDPGVLCPSVVKADDCGSPTNAGETYLDLWPGSYVHGVPEAAACSSVTLSRDQNILNEHGYAEHIFSDVVSEVEWQLRSGLDGFYEFPETEEVSVSQPIKPRPHARKSVPLGRRCVVENVFTAEMHRVLPHLDVNALCGSGDGDNRIIVPVAVQSHFPFADPHTSDNEMGEMKGTCLFVPSSTLSSQATSACLESTVGSGVQVSQMHCALEGMTSSSGVHKEVVLQGGDTRLKREPSAPTRVRRMACKVRKRLLAILNACSAGTSSVMFGAWCVTGVFLILFLLWCIHFTASV